MKNLKVMSIFGTRPDAVKMAPLVKELSSDKNIVSVVCVTAQHRSMLDQVLDIFGISPDFDLDIMQERQSLEQITSRVLEGMCNVLDKVSPDIVLVHGDTTTCFAASLAAFYRRIRAGHVEAGLRTHDRYYPYPEEMNRRLTGALCELHFAPTAANRKNLLNEGISPDKIFVTGNTVIDALKTTIKTNYRFKNPQLSQQNFSSCRYILVTAHRRENIGMPLENICMALRQIVEKYQDIKIIYPVHLNPAVRQPVYDMLGDTRRIILTEPLDVQDMHNLMNRSYLVLTDSGGLQEEAPSLGKPVLVLRNETERPEAVLAGTVRLAGTNAGHIIKEVSSLLDNSSEYDRMARAVNPYGDGKASRRITDALLYEAGIAIEKPMEFR